MKKTLKITGIIFAAIAVLFLVVAVLVKLLVTPEGVRKTVLPLAEKKLQRQVQLGDISVSIFFRNCPEEADRNGKNRSGSLRTGRTG
ncbi:hypothetical protein [Geotalea toluenoxydans]|uniref:hypothetical protein n=1 Tax=Geotalea toluenoxydans TaxID=421624 RepID=UPI0006D247EE|nr:hypothetical protein [Geotalea toluenoxydans]